MCDASNVTKSQRKAYLVLKSIKAEIVAILKENGVQFYIDGKPDPVIIMFLSQSPIPRVKRWNL
jgi:hypothetical protein